MKAIVLLAASALLVSCASTPPPTPVARGTQSLPDADPASRAIAEREVVRRQQAVLDAQELMEEGQRMRDAGDLEGSVRSYRDALQTRP